MGNLSAVLKRIALQAVIFAGLIMLSTGFLFAAAKVPDSMIKPKMLESAEELNRNPVFFDLMDNVPSSRVDRYADSITLSIAWQLDSDASINSIMWTSYYNDENYNENVNFKESLEKGYSANLQYVRYWHGSSAVVRFLHIFLSLYGIYILNAVIIAVLTVFLIIMLLRRRLFALAAGLLLSLVAAAVWFVPFSLEYTWTFILMLIFSIIMVKRELSLKDGQKKPPNKGASSILFMIFGILTNYLDFLTTETLTLLIPLIIAIYIRHTEFGATAGECRKYAVTASVNWGIGYAGMWIAKWFLASLILGENMLPYVTEHIGERLGGNLRLSSFSFIIEALKRNLSCLFPFGFGAVGLIAGIVFMLFILYLVYVYNKSKLSSASLNPKSAGRNSARHKGSPAGSRHAAKGAASDKGYRLLILTLGLLPYIRYILLRNHSYIHFFFTYRTQAATVLALSVIVYETVDWKLVMRRK